MEKASFIEVDMDFFELSQALKKSSKPMALCTVIASSGSTPRKIGAKMLVGQNGSPQGLVQGSIGGGAIEHHIRTEAIKILNQHEKPQIIKTALGHDLAMCCGGEMTVFIEPIWPKARLIFFGAGHIGQAVVKLVASLDFSLIVLDERKELLALPELSNLNKIDEISVFSIKNLNISENDYVIVCTHEHKLDQQIIEWVLAYKVKYLALIGSQRKALMTKKRLLVKNFSPSKIDQLNCPAGLKINAQTPHEIAISLVAQLIKVKNGQEQAKNTDCGSRQELSHGLSQSLNAS